MSTEIETITKHHLETICKNNLLLTIPLETNPYPEFITNFSTHTKFTKKELYNLINIKDPNPFSVEFFNLMSDLTYTETTKAFYLNLNKNINLISLIKEQIKNNFKSYFKNKKLLMSIHFQNLSKNNFTSLLQFYIMKKNKMQKYRIKLVCEPTLEHLNIKCKHAYADLLILQSRKEGSCESNRRIR